MSADLAAVRDRFCDCPGEGLPDDQHSPDGCHGLEVAAVLAPVLAAREQAARADGAYVALWDAANQVREIPCGYANPHIRSVASIKRWLHARADRIEASA